MDDNETNAISDLLVYLENVPLLVPVSSSVVEFGVMSEVVREWGLIRSNRSGNFSMLMFYDH